MYKFFTAEELKCKCGQCESDGTEMDKDFMSKVSALRQECGFPLVVTSAYRCADHPVERLKTKPGVHNEGRAIDLLVSHDKAYLLLKHAIEKEVFTGIGINQRGNGRFIHLDDVDSIPGRPRPHVWSY